MQKPFRPFVKRQPHATPVVLRSLYRLRRYFPHRILYAFFACRSRFRFLVLEPIRYEKTNCFRLLSFCPSKYFTGSHWRRCRRKFKRTAYVGQSHCRDGKLRGCAKDAAQTHSHPQYRKPAGLSFCFTPNDNFKDNSTYYAASNRFAIEQSFKGQRLIKTFRYYSVREQKIFSASPFILIVNNSGRE